MKIRKYNPKIIFIYICLLICVLGMEAGALQYNLLLIAKELGLTTAQMGNIVSVQYLAFILIPLLFGGMGDRYGKKMIVILFGLCFSCGCLTIILSNGFLAVLAGVFLMGAGYSMCEGTGTSILTDVFQENASRYINWSQSCFSIGALVSPLFSQFLCDVMNLNWRTFFGILMSIYIGLALWALKIMFPKAPKQICMDKISDKPDNQKDSDGVAFHTKIQVAFLAIAIMIYAGMENGIAYFMGTHVSNVLGNDTYNSLSLSLFWLMMIPSRYLIGLMKKSTRKLLFVSYLGAALSIGVVVMMTSQFGLLLVYAVMGFFFAPAWPLIMSEAGNLDLANSARISGIMVAFCGIGGVIAPTLFGVLADTISLKASLLFVFGITVLGLMAVSGYGNLYSKSRANQRDE